jgi:hypothetical protein
MSLLYRTPILISRKEPFIDWANSIDHGAPVLTADLARVRTVYLVTVFEQDTDLAALLDEWWPDIFEEELSAWMEDESCWPAERTRQTFEEWFDSECGDVVIDLNPDEPLTDDEVDQAAVEVALHTCAWCDAELDDEGGRTVAFPLPDRSLLSHREGRVWEIAVGKRGFVSGIVSRAESEAAVGGDDILFRACSRRCERMLTKLMPKAIRDASRHLAARQPKPSAGT